MEILHSQDRFSDLDTLEVGDIKVPDHGDKRSEKDKHSLTQKSPKTNVSHQRVKEGAFVKFTDDDLKTSDDGAKLGNDVEKSEIENFNFTIKTNFKLPQGDPGEAKFQLIQLIASLLLKLVMLLVYKYLL